jgi:hypothetical protein
MDIDIDTAMGINMDMGGGMADGTDITKGVPIITGKVLL